MAVVYTLAAFLFAQLAGSVAVIIYPHVQGWSRARSEDWLNHSTVAQFWFVLATETVAFAAIWWFVRLRKSSLPAIGWRWPRLRDPGYALAGYLVYFLAYILLLTAAKQIIPSLNLDQKQDLGFSSPVGGLNMALTFVSLVVLPPVVEETMFRGFVYTGLRGKLRPIGAALITSVVFASLHLEFGNGAPLLWVAAIDTFTLSLVLCYLREKTGGLWPGICLHALKNLVAFVTLYLIAA